MPVLAGLKELIAEHRLFSLYTDRGGHFFRTHPRHHAPTGGKLFETVERPVLRRLPASLFPVFEEAARTIHRDGYIEFKRAYYSVLPEYVGR